jgi:hypothetical protein
MSIEGGSRFSGEGLNGGGMPAPEDIQLEDCTMSVIAGNKLGIELAAELLENRIVDQVRNATAYDCKACLGRFTVSGFSNVDGDLSCRSPFLQEAKRVIES